MARQWDKSACECVDAPVVALSVPVVSSPTKTLNTSSHVVSAASTTKHPFSTDRDPTMSGGFRFGIATSQPLGSDTGTTSQSVTAAVSAGSVSLSHGSGSCDADTSAASCADTVDVSSGRLTLATAESVNSRLSFGSLTQPVISTTSLSSAVETSSTQQPTSLFTFGQAAFATSPSNRPLGIPATTAAGWYSVCSILCSAVFVLNRYLCLFICAT